MARYINISDSKGRNAQLIFGGQVVKSKIKMVTKKGEAVKNIKVLKSTLENSYESLLKKYQDPEGVADALIKDDPEINLMLTGRIVNTSGRLFLDSNFKPVFRITKKEKIFTPDGNLKEERIPKETVGNVLDENLPVKPSGKLFPKKDIYNKFVFTKKYQIRHINGLTYDFLYEIAKDLHDKDSLMLMGGGAKGTEPLVFQDGGKPYRAFLEGRIKEDSYLLILHLSNLELKPII
jgi:hypothetical protein